METTPISEKEIEELKYKARLVGTTSGGGRGSHAAKLRAYDAKRELERLLSQGHLNSGPSSTSQNPPSVEKDA